jgi:hypothetical protein
LFLPAFLDVVARSQGRKFCAKNLGLVMGVFEKLWCSTKAFWHAFSDEADARPGVQQRVERVEPLVEEPLMDDPFAPLNQNEQQVVIAPLLDRNVEFARSSKRVVQNGSELNIFSETRSVYRGDDGSPLMSVEQMFQCQSCHAVVCPDSLFTCARCGLKFCRGPGCRNEVEVDGVRLDVCPVCLRKYYKPLFSNRVARRLFDY